MGPDTWDFLQLAKEALEAECASEGVEAARVEVIKEELAMVDAAAKNGGRLPGVPRGVTPPLLMWSYPDDGAMCANDECQNGQRGNKD